MQIITKTLELREKLAKIEATEDFVTIDTEFVREKTYYPNLGLVQIGCSEDEFVIDPLSEELDIKPLNDLLQNERIIKVFHAAQQDLEILFNNFGVLPKNIFDTQIAAKFLGFGEAVSYGKLVEHYCEKTIDKSARFTDWLKRPLDKHQIAYALDDVIHLRKIFIKAKEQLEQNSRYGWVIEETSKLLDESLYQTDPEDAWKRIKFRSTDNRYLNIVKALAKWREIRAKSSNLPRMWILKDDAIQEICHIKPKKVEDLQSSRFFKFNEKTSLEIVNIVQEALASKEILEVDKGGSFSDAIAPVITLLKILLRNQSIENNIAPSVIADVEDLKDIAFGDFKKNKAMKGWRYDIFGSFAKKLIEGKVALSAKGKNVFIIDLERHIV